jgi:hypothetical protein
MNNYTASLDVDIHPYVWNILSQKEKNDYIKAKKVIKNSVIITLSSVLIFGDNLFLNINKLNDFLEYNCIQKKEFYQYLKEYQIKYDICKEDNTIKGISIKDFFIS